MSSSTGVRRYLSRRTCWRLPCRYRVGDGSAGHTSLDEIGAGGTRCECTPRLRAVERSASPRSSEKCAAQRRSRGRRSAGCGCVFVNGRRAQEELIGRSSSFTIQQEAPESDSKAPAGRLVAQFMLNCERPDARTAECPKPDRAAQPAAGGVCFESASSSTTRLRSSVVPLRYACRPTMCADSGAVANCMSTIGVTRASPDQDAADGALRQRDGEADEHEPEDLRLRRGMQSRRHVAEPQQSDRGGQAEYGAEQYQHEDGDVDDGVGDGKAEHVHGVVLSLLATKRATEIDPKTPTAAMISSTGMLRVCPLIAISAPSTHMTSVSSTSDATARSRIDGTPHDPDDREDRGDTEDDHDRQHQDVHRTPPFVGSAERAARSSALRARYCVRAHRERGRPDAPTAARPRAASRHRPCCAPRSRAGRAPGGRGRPRPPASRGRARR